MGHKRDASSKEPQTLPMCPPRAVFWALPFLTLADGGMEFFMDCQ